MNTNNNQELHVVFGAGNVGKCIMKELRERGQRVRMVNRSGMSNAPAGVEVMPGDMMDVNFAKKAAEGATVIYNTLNPPYDKWVALFPILQANVIEAAASAEARLVVLDNLYMYGSPKGQPITENMPYDAHTKKGKLRAQMAHDLMAAHDSGKVKVTVGRASDFYGPGVEQSPITAERALGAMLKGKAASVVGNPDLLHTHSYVPDVAKGLIVLGENESAYGQVWHLPTAPTGTTRELLTKISKAAGLNEVKINAAPKLILRIMGLFQPMVAEVYEMLYEFEEPFVLDHSKFDAAFGDISTPLDEAIAETVAYYRQ
ncbi:MAG: NAD-dependent epimerase/dehydratase family protein [Anaerolineae bacterium]|nr:NAD-dependent epimerase/dehydratase family protein [Anaerolineae bacterium]